MYQIIVIIISIIIIISSSSSMDGVQAGGRVPLIIGKQVVADTCI